MASRTIIDATPSVENRMQEGPAVRLPEVRKVDNHSDPEAIA